MTKVENSKLVNIEEDILIGEKEYKVKELSLQDVLSFMKDFAKNMYLKDAREIAAMMPEKERAQFMLNVWKDMPRGASLDQLSGEILGTPEAIFDILAITLAKSNNKLSKEQAKELIDKNVNNENVEYYINVAMRAIGMGNVDKEDEGTEKNA